MPLESAPSVSEPAISPSIFTFQRPYGAPRIHMDENASGSPSATATSTVDLPADAPASFNSSDEAAAYLVGLRQKKATPEAVEPEAEAPVEEEELPEEGDVDPAEPLTDEEPDADPAPKEPPIERPRSWTKDEDAEWQSLPRATQQKIVAREQERDKGTRQSQNEAAEARKAAQAERTQAEQARSQYEEHAKGALKVLEREQLRDFPDIKTMDDVKALLEKDPLRYLQWDAHQKEMVAASIAVKDADTRKASEEQTNWTSHIQAENALATAAIPELADKEKGPALMKRAADRLGELGFSQQELNDLANGKQKLSIYDHRFQQLVFADLKLSDLQKTVESAKKAALKPAVKVVPPVQRPGVARPKGEVESTRIQALNAKLTNSGSEEDAVALLIAQRARRR